VWLSCKREGPGCSQVTSQVSSYLSFRAPAQTSSAHPPASGDSLCSGNLGGCGLAVPGTSWVFCSHPCLAVGLLNKVLLGTPGMLSPQVD
jgi:hypothetical protein